MPAEALTGPLQERLREVRTRQEADLARGLGRAPVPDALIRKYPDVDPSGPGKASWRRCGRA